MKILAANAAENFFFPRGNRLGSSEDCSVGGNGWPAAAGAQEHRPSIDFYSRVRGRGETSVLKGSLGLGWKR
jgi:hypothetical protein